MKKTIISIIIFLIIFFSFVFIDYNIKNNTALYIYLKSQISYKTKLSIRTKLQSFAKYFDDEELLLEKLDDIDNTKIGKFKVFNNKLLNFKGPRAYMASDNENFFLITGNGSLYYTKLNGFTAQDDLDLIKIQSNIPKIFKNYKMDKNNELERSSMVKSIIIKDNIMYISATVKENSQCYKQKIFKADLNLKKIYFNEFFQVDDCRTFYDDTSGGNIIFYKENKILYTLGDWKSCQYLDKYPKNFCTLEGPQNLKSSLGKIMLIDLETKKNQYISAGHNNPRELHFMKKQMLFFQQNMVLKVVMKLI